MDDNLKIELLRRAISTEQGWKNLVVSFNGADKAREECKRLFRVIVGNEMVNVGDSEISLYSMLISTLEGFERKAANG